MKRLDEVYVYNMIKTKQRVENNTISNNSIQC